MTSSAVGSLSSLPYYSYLNTLQGSSAAATPGSTSSGSGSSTAGTSATATSQSLVSSLLGNSNAYSSEALSLLQENSSGSFDPITTLLGGTGTNDALTSEYAGLYASAVSASLAQAQTDGTEQEATTAQTTSSTDPVFNLINGQTQASIAYNQTIQQNAQSVLSANSYGPDGVTPLVV